MATSREAVLKQKGRNKLPPALLECAEQKLQERDWPGYLDLYGSDERFEHLKRLLANYRIEGREYWELIRLSWMRSEVGFPNQEQWLAWFESNEPGRSHLMSRWEHTRLASLPDKLTLYRGCGGMLGEPGMSWTLSRAVATRFANYTLTFKRNFLLWVPPGIPTLLEGECRKADVLAYFSGRQEQEIVLNPAHVSNFAVAPIPT